MYSQTWANNHLSTAITILESHLFNSLWQIPNSEQRPHVNNGRKFRVRRVVVVQRFDCNNKIDDNINEAHEVYTVFLDFNIAKTQVRVGTAVLNLGSPNFRKGLPNFKIKNCYSISSNSSKSKALLCCILIHRVSRSLEQIWGSPAKKV